jgi:hypothetical protein
MYNALPWVTFVRDVFGIDEASAIRAALDDIASPSFNHGWNSDAIYSFWDVATREILYLGLASDVSQRFAAHAGIHSKQTVGNKQAEVAAHLATHGQIGYSVVLHVSAIPMTVGRNRRQLGPEFRDTDNKRELADLEGRMIEAHRQLYGQRPPWNKMGGAATARAQLTNRVVDRDLFERLTGLRDDLFCARATIRVLSENPFAMYLELHMDAVRGHALLIGFERATTELANFGATPPPGLTEWLARPSPFLQ